MKVIKKKSRADAIADFFGTPHAASTGGRVALLTGTERFVGAQGIVLGFYAVLAFLAATNLYSWNDYLAATHFTPRWPVFWLRFIDAHMGISIILWLHLIGGLLGVMLSRYRWARVVVFLSLLEFLAFKFSFGSINHGDHLGVLISFMLIFLPAGWRSFPTASVSVRGSTLLVFSACQGMIMLTYSMAGLWKVGGVVEQMLRGEKSYLSLTGLAHQIAAKLLSDNATSVLGPWLIEHAWIGWPMILVALYLELFALWAVPRPSLHQTFGMGLILLHLSTHLTMGVGFAQNTLWLALFLVFSPFRSQKLDGRQMLGDLPLFGRWAQKLGYAR